MSNIEGYLLVPSVLPQRCIGCVFAGMLAGIGPTCTFSQKKIAKMCMADQDSIYIEDTDEAKAVYARRRLLGADHAG
jgi:hypothetical protein